MAVCILSRIHSSMKHVRLMIFCNWISQKAGDKVPHTPLILPISTARPMLFFAVNMEEGKRAEHEERKNMADKEGRGLRCKVNCVRTITHWGKDNMPQPGDKNCRWNIKALKKILFLFSLMILYHMLGFAISSAGVDWHIRSTEKSPDEISSHTSTSTS